MNTRTTTRVKRSTNSVALFALTLLSAIAHAEWSVDFSHHVTATPSMAVEESRAPASVTASGELPVEVPASVSLPPTGAPALASPTPAPRPNFVESIFKSSAEPAQDVVVLNTEKGFVPSTVRVKRGQTYRIHVVNVNEKEKNVSFVLDSFSEHHATYYGKIKTFAIQPQKEGIYKFVSPETSAQGKLVVFPPGSDRLPASVE